MCFLCKGTVLLWWGWWIHHLKLELLSFLSLVTGLLVCLLVFFFFTCLLLLSFVCKVMNEFGRGFSLALVTLRKIIVRFFRNVLE